MAELPLHIRQGLSGAGIRTAQTQSPNGSLGGGPLLSIEPKKNSTSAAKTIDDKLTTSQKTFQFPQETIKYYTTFQISNYSRSDLSAIGQLDKSQGRVILPLPLNMVDVHSVLYEERSLNMVAGAAVGAFGLEGWLNTVASVGATAVGAGAAGAVAAGVQELPIVGPAVAAFAHKVKSIVGATGYTPNEFFTILFNGPQYKRHNLRFKLTPRNFQESVQIRKIINLFNNAMAPDTAGPMFTFPKIFEIAYVPNPGWVYKFKPAVMDAFAVNYTPSGGPSFFVGANANNAPAANNTQNSSNQPMSDLLSGSNNPPESVEFQMNFIELEYWLHGDFHETNTPDDGYRRNNERAM